MQREDGNGSLGIGQSTPYWCGSTASRVQQRGTPASAGTPEDGDLPAWCSHVWRLPSIWPRAAPLCFSEGQCCESKKRGRLVRWGRKEGRGHGGQVVGSDSEEKVMSLLAYAGLEWGTLESCVPLLCEAGTLGKLRMQWGLGASCMSSEGGHIVCFAGLCPFRFLLSPYLKSAILLFPPPLPGSLQLLLQLWQTTEQNSNQSPCSAMISTQKKQPAKYSGLKLPAVCWSVYLARLMLFYLLKCHDIHPGGGGRNTFCNLYWIFL